MIYDAVVVGGGPAGAAAASVLAAGGARVLLLEKAQLPRYKPCGGGITARARGASTLATAFRPETLASAVQLVAGKHEVNAPLPAPIGMSMRDRFDAYLVERAAAAGTVVRDGQALSALDRLETAPSHRSTGTDRHDAGLLRLSAGTDRILTRFVIGADGANGATARLAGFPPGREPAVAIEAELAVPDRALARYADRALLDFGTVPGGYAWIFGKADHLSIGVYSIDPRAHRDLRPILERLLAGHPDLLAGRILLRRGHRVPLAGGRDCRQLGAVLLAGDAAALADPLTGEGISYALASGRRAGATVLAALQGAPEALAGYDRYLRHDLCGDLRYARLVATVAYRYPQFGLRLTAEHDGMRALTAAAVSGTLEYRTLAAHVLAGTPKLARYAWELGARVIR